MQKKTIVIGLCISLSLAMFIMVADNSTALPVEKDMTFFLHWVNDTETPKSLHGYAMRNYFDTTQDFESVNRSVTSTTKWNEDWYLYPSLAGDFTTDSFNFGIWMNASGGQKSAQIKVEIYEVTDAGIDSDGTLIHSENFGNVQLFTSPHFEIFQASFTSHTFNAGSSIRMVIEMTPGASTFITLMWDTATTDSRVSFSSMDSMKIDNVRTLDYALDAKTGFDPIIADKTMYIRTNVTDPFGGYDIKWVNITLESPTGILIFDNESMTKISGTPLSYVNEYEKQWNYSGYPAGRYNITIWAVDNNGYNYYTHFSQFTYGDYPETYYSYFTIGLNYFVNIKAEDSLGHALEGATVVASASGSFVASDTTDSNGLTNLSLFSGNYQFKVIWQGITVATQDEVTTDDVFETSPIVIVCQVYYPRFLVVDSHDEPLPNAAIYIIHPNGSSITVMTLKTNETGHVSLSQVPVGVYNLTVEWRGVEVASSSVSVDSNGEYTVQCLVYYLTVKTVDSNNNPIPLVHIAIRDGFEFAIGSDYTNDTGESIFRLASGDYRIEARYIGTYYLSNVDLTETINVTLEQSKIETIVFDEFPTSFFSTMAFITGLMVVIIIILVMLISYFMIRRYRKQIIPEPTETNIETPYHPEEQPPLEDELMEP